MPLDSSPPVDRWDDALVRLYEQHYDQLVRLAYLVSGQAGRAEEVVQDAFVTTHQAWANVRDPLPYLRTTVVNGCRTVGRRLQVERRYRPGGPEPVGLGAAELWDALAALSDRQRAAIVLRFYCDLPDHDIAAALGCRQATVRTSTTRTPGPATWPHPTARPRRTSMTSAILLVPDPAGLVVSADGRTAEIPWGPRGGQPPAKEPQVPTGTVHLRNVGDDTDALWAVVGAVTDGVGLEDVRIEAGTLGFTVDVGVPPPVNSSACGSA